MTNLRAIIIDDEPLAHRIIKLYAADVPFLGIVGQCYVATDAYAVLSTMEVDVIFLDIQMPKLKGLDFLRTLRSPPKVIVTTAYEEYAIEGFELQVSDYLLKPFSFDRFVKAVNVVRRSLESRDEGKLSPRNLFVKVDRKQIQISTDRIQCLESYGNYVKIWLDEEMLLTPNTLTHFESELSELPFERIHKSYIINRDYIDFVEGNMVQLKNAMQIPIGKSFRSKVKDWYQ